MQSIRFAAVAAPILLGALNAPRLRAQSALAADQKLPAFEVASVKPSNSSMGRVGVNTSPGGRFSAVNTPLAMLVQFAYRMQPHQVVGGPDWFSSIASISSPRATTARLKTSSRPIKRVNRAGVN